MSVWCYVVSQDHGFAPNPFHGVCTLATCKPRIRKHAEIDDWVLGMGPREHKRGGRAVFMMRITEDTTFDNYWSDPRFAFKKPVVNGSYIQMFGDNIYRLSEDGKEWIQADSRHSRVGGVTNEAFLSSDTRMTDRVLISDDFIYWGDNAPFLPPSLAEFGKVRRGERKRFEPALVTKLLRWYQSHNERGRVDDPFEWRPDRLKRWR